MEQIEEEKAKTEAAIVRVEAEIEKTEKRLDAEGLSKEDVAYWRKKEEQLRKEKEQLREKELILLKHRLPQGLPPLYPAERDMSLDRKVDLLLEHTLTTDRATPQYSAAHFGSREKKRLESDERFTEFEEHVGEESILSSEELEALSQMANEHQIVAFITPHLEKIFCNCDVEFSVFNSEEYKWIETTSETSVYNEKPDLLVCHPAITSQKPPFNSQDTVLNQMREGHSFKYGVLSDWKLRDAIGLTCEAKVSIDNKGFGEVINYGAHLCFGKDGCTATRLILFDKTQCKVLTAACRCFQLTVGEGSFLGAGAFGFLFRATRSDGRYVALKVVNGDGVVRLEREEAIMSAAHNACPGAVMGIEKDGFATFEDTGAALLLSQVGVHYSKLDPQSIVDSLKALHKSGIVHGDARLDNVVCVDGKPVWVDFADSVVSPAAPMARTKDESLRERKV